jgi:DNA-binding transcriptional MerR regulator
VVGRNKYRVDELAELGGISVELVRSYQSRGLLPPPEHEGRVAWYDKRHLDRLRRIRELKAKGWSLRSIAEALADGDRGGLRGIVEAAVGPEDDDETFDVAELAERTGVPAAVLRSFEASGVLRPRHDPKGNPVYTSADVHSMSALLSLIGTGVPMEEFMAVADVQLAAVQRVAQGTFDLFLRYQREPLLARALSPKVEADRLAASLRVLVQSVGDLLSYNFSRTLLDVAQAYIDEHGTKAERAALARLPEVG